MDVTMNSSDDTVESVLNMSLIMWKWSVMKCNIQIFMPVKLDTKVPHKIDLLFADNIWYELFLATTK